MQENIKSKRPTQRAKRHSSSNSMSNTLPGNKVVRSLSSLPLYFFILEKNDAFLKLFDLPTKNVKPACSVPHKAVFADVIRIVNASYLLTTMLLATTFGLTDHCILKTSSIHFPYNVCNRPF